MTAISRAAERAPVGSCYQERLAQRVMLQLNPPLPLKTSKGDGLAYLVIDYGPEHHLLWVVFMNQGGQCWTFQNPEVSMPANFTMGRTCN